MTCNVGRVERPIRMIVGIALLAAAVFADLSTGWLIAFSILGGVALITGLVGYCPAWSLLRINTCEAKTTRKAA